MIGAELIRPHGGQVFVNWIADSAARPAAFVAAAVCPPGR
jgi:hypothetical protein